VPRSTHPSKHFSYNELRWLRPLVGSHVSVRLRDELSRKLDGTANRFCGAGTIPTDRRETTDTPSLRIPHGQQVLTPSSGAYLQASTLLIPVRT
jgi:hypothetical protein